MRLAIPCVATVLWTLICCESVLSASVKDTDRKIVKRQVEMIPAIFGGAVDTAMDMMGQFAKGIGMPGSSNTDASGIPDALVLEGGSEGRKKRSAAPCNNATNPDTEVSGRRRRSAQTNENPPRGPPPEGSPPNGPPPNGPPPNGPPPNGLPPNGPPPNGQSPPNGQLPPQFRKKRSAVPCNNATNPDTEVLGRRRRSAQTNENPPRGPPPEGSPPNGPPPNGPPPNGPPPNGLPPNGPPPNGQSPPNGQLPPQFRKKRSAAPCNNATNADTEISGRSKRSAQTFENAPIEPSIQLEREKRSAAPCRNATSVATEILARRKRSAQSNGPPPPPNGPPPSGPPPNGQPPNDPRNCTRPANGAPQSGSNTLVREKRAPTDLRTMLSPQRRNDIGELQRTRRDVSDPDKVVPASSSDEKNLFDRIVQVAKEVVARVTRWVDDMDKEQATANSKTAAEKPKL